MKKIRKCFSNFYDLSVSYFVKSVLVLVRVSGLAIKGNLEEKDTLCLNDNNAMQGVLQSPPPNPNNLDISKIPSTRNPIVNPRKLNIDLG